VSCAKSLKVLRLHDRKLFLSLFLEGIMMLMLEYYYQRILVRILEIIKGVSENIKCIYLEEFIYLVP